VQGAKEIFLVEGYVDALAIAATGRPVIAVGGTGISDAQQAELRRLLPEDATLYILPDADDEGEKAARVWARKFFPNAKICPAHYGEGAKDIADTFASMGAEGTADHLDRLMSGGQDLIDIETEIAAELEVGVREKLAHATEHIVPLLARIQPVGLQDATADIVNDKVKGLKKSWLNNAIKDETERLRGELFSKIMEEQEQEQERLHQEHLAKIAESQDEIDELFTPGVLERLRDTAAAMHHVFGDREPLELALLVALGAQLEPLPNGRPLDASILLTAEAGRGKNHIVDAAVKPLPEKFYFAFEIASGQSLYYKAEEDPDFLKHTFAYPNEIEGAEALWEFLRPMLSKGRATKIVTAKDLDGNPTSKTIVVEGPVTIAIPTIRNKTDEQLQTRLLVAELPDYPGRVKQHSTAISEQLLPGAAKEDHSHQRWLWQERLRQLTEVRRVVFDLPHPDFALDDDQVSHGARLWANLLSVMASHAWIEQRNRRLLDVGEDKVAIEATPEDYEAAYRIFTKVCNRTIINLSDTHRKMLQGTYDLQQEHSDRFGFRQRDVAEKAGVSLGAVSKNKTFLVTSAKLMRETEDGFSLVEGADPSWWSTEDLSTGLPTPEMVRTWWENRDPDPDPPKNGEHAPEHDSDADTYGENGVHGGGEQRMNMFTPLEEPTKQQGEPGEHVHGVFTEGVNTGNGLDKPNKDTEEGVFTVFTDIEGSRKTRVVNVKSGEPYDVYIGRENSYYGLKRSDWHNPFEIGEDKEGSREEVIEKFERYLLERPDLMARLPELKGKTLGCWCAPEKRCHGHVLADLADKAGPLEEFLADPPQWFRDQAADALRHGAPDWKVNPLANAVANRLYGGPQRWREAVPAVKEWLGREGV